MTAAGIQRRSRSASGSSEEDVGAVMYDDEPTRSRKKRRVSSRRGLEAEMREMDQFGMHTREANTVRVALEREAIV